MKSGVKLCPQRDLSEVFKVARPTIYHTLAWQPAAAATAAKGKPNAKG